MTTTITKPIRLSRRAFMGSLGLMTLGVAFTPRDILAMVPEPLERAIPSSGERIPVIGMGTSRTFNAGSHPDEIERLADVLSIFFQQGGTVIDSSPMYGSAERVVGRLLSHLNADGLFAATKVWTDGRQAGEDQMRQSMRLMGVEVMDLMQIHNLRDWRTHLETLRQWRSEGKIRYIGVTTSHGRDHRELEEIMRTERIDFVQFSYNIEDRVPEERLLPLAADRGIATLINRPYQRGGLFVRVKGQAVPEWAGEFDARSWGQFFLKFILAHPAVTCIIPATSKTRHMKDNMGANFGRIPDSTERKKMIQYVESI
ncbi:aldo/keto reductase [Desulfatitalea tepidiphila]|uniref:aldo/keto reductase n=1 Tax=Desulfatitalea tepidiphila TaxID=1185843 RepID=UPI0006B50DAA|nr:aldo/keto reductase [Desulfatitalea tepidiphila]